MGRDDWTRLRVIRSGGPRPVEGGLTARSKRGDIGEKWWSRRFIEMLESLGFGTRLDRGRHYARRGQVMDLEVRPGVVEARVQGSRPKPYRVRLGVEVIGEDDWRRVEQAMAAKAVFAAKLLAGEMPRDIEDVFASCDLSLFPDAARQLSSSCTCPDWASPCKHVAAVFYLLAEAFDRDPFLVLTWRGRTREQLMTGMGAVRWTAAPEAEKAPQERPPEVTDEPLEQAMDRFWEAGPDLERIRVRPWLVEATDSMIRQLGPTGITVRGTDLADLLASACRTLAAAAQRRALGD